MCTDDYVAALVAILKVSEGIFDDEDSANQINWCHARNT
jgi:hypothetical protein